MLATVAYNKGQDRNILAELEHEGYFSLLDVPKPFWEQVRQIFGFEVDVNSIIENFALHQFSRSSVYLQERLVMEEEDEDLDYLAMLDTPDEEPSVKKKTKKVKDVTSMNYSELSQYLANFDEEIEERPTAPEQEDYPEGQDYVNALRIYSRQLKAYEQKQTSNVKQVQGFKKSAKVEFIDNPQPSSSRPQTPFPKSQFVYIADQEEQPESSKLATLAARVKAVLKSDPTKILDFKFDSKEGKEIVKTYAEMLTTYLILFFHLKLKLEDTDSDEVKFKKCLDRARANRRKLQKKKSKNVELEEAKEVIQESAKSEKKKVETILSQTNVHNVKQLTAMTPEQLEKAGYMCRWTDETKVKQNIYFIDGSVNQYQPTMKLVCSRKVVTSHANSDAPASDD